MNSLYLSVKSGQAGMVEEEEEEEVAQMESHLDDGAGEMNEGDGEEDDEDMDVEQHVNGS